jgi:hypothetical protein
MLYLNNEGMLALNASKQPAGIHINLQTLYPIKNSKDFVGPAKIKYVLCCL